MVVSDKVKKLILAGYGQNDPYCLSIYPANTSPGSLSNFFLVQQEWRRFLQYFNARCNAFCRRDPPFADFLEKVIRFTDWTFPDEMKDYALSSYTEARTASILANAEQYPDKFLAAFYSMYQKIPHGDKGIFLQSVTEETGQALVEELYSIGVTRMREFWLYGLWDFLYSRVERDKKDKPRFPVRDYKAVLKDTPFYDLLSRLP